MKLSQMRIIGWHAALTNAERGKPRALADILAAGGAPRDAECAQRLAEFIRSTATSSKDTPLSLEAIFTIRDRRDTFRIVRADLLCRARWCKTAKERAQHRREATRYTITALLAEFDGLRVLDAHGNVVRLTKARVRDIVYGRS